MYLQVQSRDGDLRQRSGSRFLHVKIGRIEGFIGSFRIDFAL
jgi:hypothetical protein